MIHEGVCCVCYQSDNVLCVSEENEKKRLIVNILQFCHQWRYPGSKAVSVCCECVTKLEVCNKLMQDHIQHQHETRRTPESNNGQTVGPESDGEQLVIDEQDHMDEPESRPSRMTSCDFCGKVFSHRGDLNKHRRTHTGERPYVCTECGRQFSHTSNLLRHRKIHSGETPFSCTACGKRYSRKDKLAAHMRSTHSDSVL